MKSSKKRSKVGKWESGKAGKLESGKVKNKKYACKIEKWKVGKRESGKVGKWESDMSATSIKSGKAAVRSAAFPWESDTPSAQAGQCSLGK